MKPALLVLAAGAGSRYGGLKQIEAIGPNGETLLDYSVQDAMRAGFGRLVFVIRKSFETDFRRVVGARYEGTLPVEYVFQEVDNLPRSVTPPPLREKPWGTGHAVLVARDAIAEPFAVINADDFYGREAFQLLSDFLSAPNAAGDYTLVAYQLDRTLSEHGAVSRGICRAGAEGLLQEVREVTGIEKYGNRARAPLGTGWEEFTGEEPVSMNCWGFTPGLFPELERLFAEFLSSNAGDPKAEFYLPAAVDKMITAGTARVSMQRTSSAWFGMTHREDKERVRQSIAALVEQGVYAEG